MNNKFEKNNLLFIQVWLVYFLRKINLTYITKKGLNENEEISFFFFFFKKPLLEILAADLSWETYIGQEEWNNGSDKFVRTEDVRKKFKILIWNQNWNKR